MINWLFINDILHNNNITGIKSCKNEQCEKLCLILLIKDEVLLMVGCPIFPPFYIDSQISVHWKFKKKIDQLIFRNAKEIYFNEKFLIL
jgi:hypothetical protein